MKQVSLLLMALFICAEGSEKDLPLYNDGQGHLGHLNTNYRLDWTTAGLLPNTVPEYGKVFNVLDYGANPAADYSFIDDKAVKAALDSAQVFVNNNPGKYSIVFFPAGIYDLFEPIVLDHTYKNIIFQGEGDNSKIYLKWYNNQGYYGCSAFIIRGEIDGAPIDHNSIINFRNYTIGASFSSLPKDTWFRLYQTDLSNLLDSQWAKDENVIGMITQKRSRTKMRDMATRIYNTNAKIQKLKPVQNIGIENLFILQHATEQNNGQSNIVFSYAVNCWVRGVHFENTSEHHIHASYSAHLEISGNYFYGAHSYGNGGWGYGVSFTNSTSYCLVENNRFKKLRHSMLVQAGANGNVFAYNYSHEPYAILDGIGSYEDSDLTCHGNYPFCNLYECNVVAFIELDKVHGANGPYNTFFRCKAETNKFPDHTHAFYAVGSPYFSLLGCILNGYDEIGSQHVTNLFGFHKNYYGQPEYALSNTDVANYYKYPVDNRLADYWLKDKSYYYASKPDFLDGYTFPAIGPTAEGSGLSQRIPAQDRGGPWIKQPVERLNIDAYWSGTVTMTSDYTVPEGKILIIEPGTTVKLGSNVDLIIPAGSSIIAKGHSYYTPIKFIRLNSDQKWGYIHIKGEKCEFDNCLFDGGTHNILLFNSDKNHQFDHCCSKNAYSSGFYAYKSSFTITNSVIKDNRGHATSHGIRLSQSYGKISSSTIRNNTGNGLYMFTSTLDSFALNHIYDNGKYGFYLLNGSFLSLDIGALPGRNKIVNNDAGQIYLDGWNDHIYAGDGTYPDSCSSSGFNDIYGPGYYIKHASASSWNSGNYLTRARRNYWNTTDIPTLETKFFPQGSVDYTQYMSSSQSSGAGAPGNIYQRIETGSDKQTTALSLDSDINLLFKPGPPSDIIASFDKRGKDKNIKINDIDINLKFTELFFEIENNKTLYKNSRRLIELYDLMKSNEVDNTFTMKKILRQLYLDHKNRYKQDKIKKENGTFKKPASVYYTIREIGEVAALLDIDMSKDENNFTEALAKIEDCETYFYNGDSWRELLKRKIYILIQLERAREALDVMPLLREKSRLTDGSTPGYVPPTYITLENEVRLRAGLEELDPDQILTRIAQEQLPEEKESLLPKEYKLSQNYPNPFNPSTIIPFSLPQASHVKIEIFNILGQKVAVLVDKNIEAGYHQVEFNMTGALSSSMYLVRAVMQSLENKNEIYTFNKKITILK
jgi:hypothetical protein